MTRNVEAPPRYSETIRNRYGARIERPVEPVDVRIQREHQHGHHALDQHFYFIAFEEFLIRLARFKEWCKDNYKIIGLSSIIFVQLILIIVLGIAGFFPDFGFENSSHAKDNIPRFYEKTDYKGGFYTPHPTWENEYCVNMPKWFDDRAMSIRTGTHCIEVCEKDNCQVHGKGCEKIFIGSYSHNDLEKIQMGRKISSFKRCNNY